MCGTGGTMVGGDGCDGMLDVAKAAANSEASVCKAEAEYATSAPPKRV